MGYIQRLRKLLGRSHGHPKATAPAMEKEHIMPEEQTVLEERVAFLEAVTSDFAKYVAYLKAILAGTGFTFVALLGGVYWLGSLTTTVSRSSEKTDKIYDIVLESKDSLKERTSVLETELKAIHQSLDNLSTRPKSNKPTAFLLRAEAHHQRRPR